MISKKVRFALRFIDYWLHAVDDHSLHHPFIYKFYNEVIKPSLRQKSFDDVEHIRQGFLRNKERLEFNQVGAGSTVVSTDHWTVQKIAHTSVSPKKVSALLYNIGRFLKSDNVVELGTSLGVNTRWMAQIEEANIHTIEGVPEIYDLAVGHLHNLSNVRTYCGDIDELLPDILAKLSDVDMAYLDANHTYEATLRYYELIAVKRQPSSVIVVGDIHWSDEMEKAWDYLMKLEEVTLTVDLFHCGLIFFIPVKEKQHYRIWF